MRSQPQAQQQRLHDDLYAHFTTRCTVCGDVIRRLARMSYSEARSMYVHQRCALA